MNDVFLGQDGKWYFWDETELYDYGPYNTEEEAENAWRVYWNQLLSD